MASVPSSARVVVIGAGIVGNSLVEHLARLGWTDIVQIDKGPLPNPGGSTGHASNFMFPVDHSREITDLTLDSIEQYKEMGVFTSAAASRSPAPRSGWRSCGGGCRRRRPGGSRPSWSAPRSWPRRCRSSTPTRSSARSGRPSVGVVDSLRAGTIMRERAMASGALTVVPTVEVTGLDVEDGRDPAGPHQRRRHRGRDRGHRLRRVEPEDRRHGRHQHPADPGRAPDDQRRARARS